MGKSKNSNLLEGKSRTKFKIFGLFATCYALAFGRWGANLPQNPFYFLDFLLVTSFFVRNKVIFPIRILLLPTMFYSGLIFACALESEVSDPIEFLRDLAPFVYFFIFPLVANNLSNSTYFSRKELMRVFRIVLVFHQIWFTLFTFFPSLRALMPIIPGSQNVHLFQVRPDFDTALSSVLFALLLFDFLSGKNWIKQLFLISIILATTFSNQTRTGIITLTSSLLLTFYVSTRSREKGNPKKNISYLIILGLAMFLVVVYFSLISIHLPLFDKFINTFAFLGQNGSLNSGQELGGGTASARLSSWSFLIENQFSDVGLLLFGYGFGTNYMLTSGASFLLLGSSSLDLEFTRNPHNFILSVFCRLGIMGLILLILFYLSVSKSCIKVLRSGKDQELSILSITMVTSLFLTSLFGVILETPFGAIPFYFFSAFVFMEGKKLNVKASQK